MKNFKIIVICSFIFFILILGNYFINRALLNSLIISQQKSALEIASKNINKWFINKVNNVNKIRDIITEFDHRENKDEILNILKNSKEIAGLRNVYIGYEDNDIISSINWVKPKNYQTKSRPWYKYTLQENKTIVTKPYIDVGLKEAVISVCTVLNERATITKGVICGILPINNIKDEILDIYLPFDGITFIMDKNGKIILHHNPKKLLTKSDFYISKDTHSITNKVFKESIFSQNYIEELDWYIVSKLTKNSVYKKLNQQLLINFFIYFISLIVFLILNYFYYKYQKNNENKLKKIEDILRGSIEQSTTGRLILDTKNKIIFYNIKLLELLDLTSNDLDDKILNKSTKIFDNLEYKNKDKILDSLHTVKCKLKEKDMYLKFQINDERIFFYYLIISPVLNKNGIYQGIIFSFKNITSDEEKKIKEKQNEDILFQQSKMADLGEMLAAVSHQWKQPLNSLSLMLSNLLQFKKMEVLNDKLFEENISSGISITQYLSETLNTFKNFYLPKKEKENFEIKNAIDEVFNILIPYFKNSGIELKIESEMYGPLICKNYKNEFQQIIINLLHNSKDAILENKSSNKIIEINIERIQSAFIIKVSDYGIGISSEVKKNLFKPFFSSKKEKGTGKGLYISRLIAREKLTGDLKLISDKNPTTFLLKLSCEKLRND